MVGDPDVGTSANGLVLLLSATCGVTVSAAELPTADRCIACHSGLRDASGQDVSIGHDWRATMMAHAARDPYWQASVRRETMDHPERAAEIEDTCATCHMPAARAAARTTGQPGRVFAHLGDAAPGTALALDGVSCAVCHRIAHDGLGEPTTFDGNFRIATGSPGTPPPAYGPFDVIPDLERVMHSAAGMVPVQASHIQQSTLCATCHTLFTRPTGSQTTHGTFPEQTPYLEWLQSAYSPESSCQSCHMPLASRAPIASVLGDPRDGLSRHQFRGGNAFMLRLLDRYRHELGVTAPSADLKAAAAATEHHLHNDTAGLDVILLRREGDDLLLDLQIENLAGHKLPTAYPSRRTWLHVAVRDPDGAILFESGALRQDGSIAGNDNDDNGTRHEPHHVEIATPEDVQIYESVIVDARGRVTTGLLHAARYIKDNRLLPHGFDKAAASDATAVHGRAAGDSDFIGGGDTVRYRIPLGPDTRAASISARLLFQTVAFRWAENLARYDSTETTRFVRYYREQASRSAVVLAGVETEWIER